jgi:GNAT superfamily N-acetyltransferase
MTTRRPRGPAGFLRELKEVVLPSGPSAAEGLFLDRFTPAALERELEAAGIHHQLAARGYGALSVDLSRVEREHRVRVLAAGTEPPLIELRMSEITCVPKEPALKEHGMDVLYLLAVHWLSLQDPRAEFSPGRPALPGQVYPGLGIGRRLLSRLLAWAHDWGKDALVNYPAHYHNAVFYSRLFRFLSARREGRMCALRRDLESLSVTDASWAVEQGRVVEEPGGKVLRWRPSEMVAPITRVLKTYMKSDPYEAAVAEAREATHYRLLERRQKKR